MLSLKIGWGCGNLALTSTQLTVWLNMWDCICYLPCLPRKCAKFFAHLSQYEKYAYGGFNSRKPHGAYDILRKLTWSQIFFEKAVADGHVLFKARMPGVVREQIWIQHTCWKAPLCSFFLTNRDNQWRLTAYCNFCLMTRVSDFIPGTIKLLSFSHFFNKKFLRNVISHILNYHPIIDFFTLMREIAA